MYRRLGGPEIDDVIIAAKYLIEESEWKEKLDPDRVGVWGWSYGGWCWPAIGSVLTCVESFP